MYSHTHKKKQEADQDPAAQNAQNQGTFLEDNRPGSAAQKKLQDAIPEPPVTGDGTEPIQRYIMDGSRAVPRSSLTATVEAAFRQRMNRVPNPTEIAALRRLTAWHGTHPDRNITLADLISQVAPGRPSGVRSSGAPARSAAAASASTPVTTPASAASREVVPGPASPAELPASATPVIVATAPTGTGTVAAPPSQEATGAQSLAPAASTPLVPATGAVTTPAAATSSTPAEAVTAPASGSSAVISDRRTAHNLSGIPSLRQDTETHVGFEIELGRIFTFPRTRVADLEPLVNHTLFTCVIPAIQSAPVLEMLLDDVRQTASSASTGQVEFRTTPLRFAQINMGLREALRAAIAGFPVDVFGRSPGPIEFSYRQGRVSGTGRWEPTSLVSANAALLRRGSTTGRFSSPAEMAQHATTSIELDAFARLNAEQQALLLPSARGAGTKQAVVDAMAARASGDNLNATTTGRNDEAAMAKSPIESIVGADPSIRLPAAARRAGSVRISDLRGSGQLAERHAFVDAERLVADIRRGAAFPTHQGEGGHGFRAVAEKLQAPLEDTHSGELRILIEHRRGALRDAVNAALGGSSGALEAFAAAARAMDDARRSRSTSAASSGTPAAAQTGAPVEPATTAVTGSGSTSTLTPATGATAAATAPAEAAAGAPFIANPIAPMTLQQMIAHYQVGIVWAAAHGGTFSPEFLLFRDHTAAAMQVVVAGGLNAGQATAYELAIPLRIAARNAIGPHPEADVQQQVFDDIDGYASQLWALHRYLTQRPAAPAAAVADQAHAASA
jgi:hypothetical protein